MSELGWLLLLLLVTGAKRSPTSSSPPLPPDENLGVHPLPPNPLKRRK